MYSVSDWSMCSGSSWISARMRGQHMPGAGLSSRRDILPTPHERRSMMRRYVSYTRVEDLIWSHQLTNPLFEPN